MRDVQLRVQSAELRRSLPAILDGLRPGDVVEITDGRRKNAKVRGYLVRSLDKDGA